MTMEYHEIVCYSLFSSRSLILGDAIINKYRRVNMNINNDNSYHRYIHSIIVTVYNLFNESQN